MSSISFQEKSDWKTYESIRKNMLVPWEISSEKSSRNRTLKIGKVSFGQKWMNSWSKPLYQKPLN
jgi:hypothetical protein